MSKSNSAIKVLRTALKRVQKGWTKGTWSAPNNDGGRSVCLEGAIYGYCNVSDMTKRGEKPTQAQLEAMGIVTEIIKERYPRRTYFGGVPSFNDHPENDIDDVMEVIKLGIIRLETGYGEDELDQDDVDSFMESIKK